MARQMTTAALAAKAIRAELKVIGVKASVRSSNFGMGNSVSVSCNDLPPALFKKVEEAIAKYQYGSFDAMTDMYEYTNCRDDIPQAKYVSATNTYSDELRQAAYEVLRNELRFSEFLKLSENYSEATCTDYLVSREVYRFLNGSNLGLEEYSEAFWKARSAPVEAVEETSEPVAVEGIPAHIEVHTHTKKGTVMNTVVLESNVEWDMFNTLRQKAQEKGGWYSRKFGKFPGGFVFPEMETAEEFKNELNG